jgi:hypothetical protein
VPPVPPGHCAVAFWRLTVLHLLAGGVGRRCLGFSQRLGTLSRVSSNVATVRGILLRSVFLTSRAEQNFICAHILMLYVLVPGDVGLHGGILVQ